MTREEAINHLKEVGYQKSAFSRRELFYEEGSDYKQAVDALEAALRAQPSPAKLDRNRWEGCGLCKKASRISGSAFVHYGHEEVAYDGLTFSYMKYCPQCGRPLTEEAGAEDWRRR